MWQNIFCYWGTIINENLKNHILVVVYLTINCLTKKKKDNSSKSGFFWPNINFFQVQILVYLYWKLKSHPSYIVGHHIWTKLTHTNLVWSCSSMLFFAVYPAYPTTNGCRFRHRIIYPFFCACPGFPLLFCFSFVFANFLLEFEFQVLLVILHFDTPNPKIQQTKIAAQFFYISLANTMWLYNTRISNDLSFRVV